MPSRLPQLPSLCVQVDDGLASPKYQRQCIYIPKDARKIQSLDPVTTLDDLRRTGVIGARFGINSNLAYPGLSPSFLTQPCPDDDDERDDDDDEGSDGRSGSGGTTGRSRPLTRPRSASPEQTTSKLDPGRYNATAAARFTLLHERPAVVERMEKGVAACAVMRDNRHFRLLSLGVFQPSVNDVRTRSMHRVELHKHLSSTNLRAPQPDKEVRSAVQHDSVASRLERMYNRVLRAVPADDSAPSSPGLGGSYLPGGAAAGARRTAAVSVVSLAGTSFRKAAGGGGSGGGGNEEGRGGEGRVEGLIRNPTLTRTTSVGRGGMPAPPPASLGGPLGSGVGGGVPRPGLMTVSSLGRAGGAITSSGGGVGQPGSPSGGVGREGAGAGQRGAGSADYWMRVTLPPEVIEAQLRHLAASTEANLRTYHDRVASAQDSLLSFNGLSGEALQQAPEQLEQSLKIKLGQIKEDTTVNTFNYSSLSREAVLASPLGPASKQLLTATTLQQFIRAALQHVSDHAGELGGLRAAHKQQGQESTTRSITTRRRQSKSAATSTTISGVAADGTTGSGYLYDSARTTRSGTADGTPTESRASDSSGIWPSYTTVRQRVAPTPHPSTAPPPTGPQRSTGPHDDAQLEHLRRHASPDSAAAQSERRWSPPPPVMAPGSSRGHTAPSTAGGSGAVGGGGGRGGSRMMEVFIDEMWMEGFRKELEALESDTSDEPPEGIFPLPPLSPNQMDAGVYVRSRLNRLCTALDMPAVQQLDLVLSFTGRERAMEFARSLELWETAAAAVMARETQVEALVEVQREIEAGTASRLSLGHVAELCTRLVRSTRWLDVLGRKLADQCSGTLSYHGKPYPGSEVITADHLLSFMEQLRQVTEVTGLKP